MKKIAAISIAVIMAISFTACSAHSKDKYAGYPETIANILHTIDSEGNSAELTRNLIEEYWSINNDGTYDETIINLYRDLYTMDGMNNSDYSDLADIYVSKSNTAAAVDALEKQYRLSRDENVLQRLSGMVIDVNGSDEKGYMDILALGDLMYSGKYNEALKTILSDSWFESFRPKTLLNYRNYSYRQDDGSVLYLSVGYDEYYQKSTRAHMDRQNGKDITLQVCDSVISLVECDVSEGFYNGEYTLTQLNIEAGTVYIDRGTFKNNVLIGKYESLSCWNIDADDILTAWDDIKNIADEHYSGSFDEDGHALAEQRSDDASGSVIFAYNDSETYYLNVVPEEIDDTADYVFDIDVFRIFPVLDFVRK